MRAHQTWTAWAGAVTLIAARLTAGTVAFQIRVDTSPLQTLGSGFIDLQLNPGATDALAVQQLFTTFQSDRVVGAATLTGAASGSLSAPGGAMLQNQTSFNDIFQEMAWGSFFSFYTCLCGPGIGGSAITGTTFSLSLFGPDSFTPLLTTNPDGSLAHIDINPDGSVTPATFADDAGVKRAAIQDAAPCPEPASGAGLLELAGIALLLRGISRAR
jgi:hypothetical protein